MVSSMIETAVVFVVVLFLICLNASIEMTLVLRGMLLLISTTELNFLIVWANVSAVLETIVGMRLGSMMRWNDC